MVISELAKQRFHRGLEKNLLFFRDSNGNEVDLLIPDGTGYYAAEIKAAQTVTKSFFKGLDRGYVRSVGVRLPQVRHEQGVSDSPRRSETGANIAAGVPDHWSRPVPARTAHRHGPEKCWDRYGMDSGPVVL